jgi:hypothetical protein
MDYVVMPEEMLARCNPIQRQLLGAVSDPLSYYLPQDADVPLKALVERTTCPQDREEVSTHG